MITGIIIVIVILIIILFVRALGISAEIKSKLPDAENGDVQAMYEVGCLYEKSADYDKAISWLEKAGEKGHPTGSEKATALRMYLREKELKKQKANAAKSAKEMENLIERWGLKIKTQDNAGRTCSDCKYGNSGLKYCDESGRDDDGRKLKQALGSRTCHYYKSKLL